MLSVFIFIILYYYIMCCLFLLYLLIILVMTNKKIFKDYFIYLLDTVKCNFGIIITITVNYRSV